MRRGRRWRRWRLRWPWGRWLQCLDGSMGNPFQACVSSNYAAADRGHKNAFRGGGNDKPNHAVTAACPTVFRQFRVRPFSRDSEALSVLVLTFGLKMQTPPSLSCDSAGCWRSDAEGRTLLETLFPEPTPCSHATALPSPGKVADFGTSISARRSTTGARSWQRRKTVD